MNQSDKITTILSNLLEYYNQHTDDFSSNLILTEKILQIKRHSGNVIFNDTIWEDLGIFCQNGVYQHLQRNQTYFGFFTQAHTLVNPNTTTTPYLPIIRKLLLNTNLYDIIIKKLEIIKGLQLDVLWFWKEKTQEEEKLYQNVFFCHSYLKRLNRNRLSLVAYYLYRTIIQPIYVVFSPVLCFIIPYIVLRFKMGLTLSVPIYLKILCKIVPASFGIMKKGQRSPKKMVWIYVSTIISTVLYIQTVYSQCVQIFTLMDTSKTIKKRILNLYQTLLETRTMYQLVQFNDYNGNEEMVEIPWYLNDISENDTTPCFLWRYWLLNEDGARDALRPWLRYLGIFDMLISITTFMKQCQAKNLPISFPIFEASNPVSHLYAKDIWHPSLFSQTRNSIITNSLELGDKYRRNMLVTGPNAGGKSTLVKNICLNTLLAQTLGFTTSNYFKYTPYRLIYTHFRIHDQTGEKSLFQEEVNRCKYLFTHLKEDNFLAVFDELFCSTSVMEGISCAYALSEIVGAYKNGTTIITTHYPLLTKLAESDSSYINTMMECQIVNHKPIFSYKLLKGISESHVALNLLYSCRETEKLVKRSRALLEQLLDDNKSEFIFSKKSITAY